MTVSHTSWETLSNDFWSLHTHHVHYHITQSNMSINHMFNFQVCHFFQVSWSPDGSYSCCCHCVSFCPLGIFCTVNLLSPGYIFHCDSTNVVQHHVSIMSHGEISHSFHSVPLCISSNHNRWLRFHNPYSLTGLCNKTIYNVMLNNKKLNNKRLPNKRLTSRG